MMMSSHISESASTTLAVPTSDSVRSLVAVDWSTLLAFLAVILWAKLLLTKTCWGAKTKSLKLPPGPWGLPVIGYLPFISPNAPHLTYAAMAKRFGSIFRFQAGRKMIVIIADSRLLRDAFRREAFTGRPGFAMVDGIMEEMGISASSGLLWKEQRRFSSAVLRELGFSKIARNRCDIEGLLEGIVSDLVAEVGRLTNKPFDSNDVISFAVVNIFFNVFTGNNFRFLDPDMMVHVQGNRQSFKDISSMAVSNFFPIFFCLPQFKKKLDGIYHRKIALQRVFEVIIKDHKNSHDIKDFVSAYLKKIDEHAGNNNSSHYFSEKQLLSILGDLFGAVAETTTVNLQWFLLAMVTHPHFQKRAQQELEEIIGSDNEPQLKDLPNLPFMEAVILETMRYGSILPLGAARRTTEDTQVGGYFIPKDTTVMGLFWQCHHDKQLWKNPDTFDPENFISEDGAIKKPSHFMPFSTGRRICIGEDLAMMILFLVCSHLLHHFDFQLAPESSHITMQHTGNYILEPEKFKIIATRHVTTTTTTTS